jgi:cell wall-associated NlpC family hydrolase
MNRKKIAAMVVFGLTMTTCSTPAVGQMTQEEYVNSANVYQRQSILNMLEAQRIKQTQLEAEAEAARKLEADTALMNKTIKKLNSYVNKTWYVFSGVTPSGWDCSGLVLWFYEQQGISLEHRASAQDDAGTKTKTPKPGDIVVFKYNGSKQAYHVGIYIGDGKMIHAPKRGHVTRIEDVDSFGGSYSKVSYRTLIETN